MQKGRSTIVWIFAGSLMVGGCTGEIGDAPDPDTTVPDPQAQSPAVGPVADCTMIQPGPSPLRRLNRFEYDNTVRDLLGDTTAPASHFPPEEQSLGFDNDTTVLRVPTLLAESYVKAAQDLTANALTDMARFTGCDPTALAGNATGESDCATTFIASFGQRAFRRPLRSDEQTRLLSAYHTARAELDFKSAIGSIMETILLSPQLMYRLEFGNAVAKQPGTEAVDSWGVASRLSYFLWGSMPDAVLLDAARAGALQTPEQVRTQAERMFDDPRSRGMVRHFHDYWLDLLNIAGQGKDPAVFPDYNAQIGTLLRRQTEAFAEQVFFDPKGSLSSLLTAPFNMMNEPLAKYFGISGPVGDPFVKVALDPARNAGIVTQASIMSWNATSNRTHPILRGKFIREKLFCNQLPNPPDNIIDNRGSVTDPNATERERLAAHRNNASCASCHTLMDPIGFGLENFDASGRWRNLEGGKPVDASGEISGTDATGKFKGPIELANKLASSQEVEACVVTNWTRFANGRAETEQDACGSARLVREFHASGGSLRELLLSITQTDAFLYRTAPTAAP